MHLERYSFITERKHINYEFFSEGLNGRIRKAIIFKLIDPKSEIYNLGFGDYNEVTNELDDLSVSNNQDRDKILATIAAPVIDMLRTFRIFFMLRDTIKDGSLFKKTVTISLFR